MRFFTVKLKYVLVAFALLVAIIGASFFAKQANASAVFWSGSRSLPIYSVERSDNKISISFDCAWGVDYTDELLYRMQEANVKATFFTVQFWAEKYPDYVKKISDAGHELGTHSKTHSYMSKLSEEDIKRELTTSSEALTKITGKPVTLFRSPYGDYDNLLVDTAFSMGIYPIQWDVDSLDWKDLSAKEIASRVCGRVKSGSIILCHNNGLHTAEALPIILDTLRAKGFEFVPIGELIYKENYKIDPSGRQCLKGA